MWMPRQPRIVLPEVAHHCTQRGTNRERVFFTDADRKVYLHLLQENAEFAGLRILAYCLMPNHVHHIVVPARPDSLSLAFRRTHGRYAQYLNARRTRTGHLWQNRYFSCALDESHLWTAVRYVERNPVRSGLVDSVEAYEWSSAQAHLTGADTRDLVDMSWWAAAGGVERWQDLMASPEELDAIRLLQRHTYGGRPLGSEEFLEEIAKTQAAPLKYLRASSAA